MKKILISTLSIVAATQLFAQQPSPHTWTTVTATDSQWNVTLQIISEPEHAWFVGPDGQTKISGFKLSSSTPQKFGFAFDGGVDFNVAYSITLVEQKQAGSSNFTSKACVYVITAEVPAKPEITPISYNGAKCQWKINEDVGEDFIVG